jgi:L-seryl-tRNA(Ser) seleniumtransferase
VQRIIQRIDTIAKPTLRRVINATGVVIHTNLGRAPLGSAVLEALTPIVEGYSNLEFDLHSGERGHRDSHIRDILRYLTGADDALVVNNNAAAIMLCLSHLARGREVIVSRGELVEIGGAFRIPDIMAASGAIMKEVGTTNKTRLSDYEQAISDSTALIFKAHKSNYTIRGFTEEVSVTELAALAHRHNLPLIYDIGSGLLRKPLQLAQLDEPDVHSAIAAGADVVSFSCDKLLGGPQAGVVCGSATLIARLSRDPLMRALRVGKMTYAALGGAARHYLSDEALLHNNPLFSMLSADASEIRKRAVRLKRTLSGHGIYSSLVDSNGQCGGGTLPDVTIKSFALKLNCTKAEAQRIHGALREQPTPVVAILREGGLFFDLLTVNDIEIALLVESLRLLTPQTTSAREGQ